MAGKKAKKKTPFLLRRISVPIGVAIAVVLTPIAFAFAVLTLNQ